MSSSTLRQPTCGNAHESSGKRLRPGGPAAPTPVLLQFLLDQSDAYAHRPLSFSELTG
jgi:hypothetical protein